MLIKQIINKRLKNDFKCLENIQEQTEFGGELMLGKVDHKDVRDRKSFGFEYSN